MTGHVRRLAEHLATMETGWRQYAWAIAAGLFTALGATAYAVEQSAYGAGFFVLAVLLLVGSGWSRWYLRTHRRPTPGGVITAAAVDERVRRVRMVAELQRELDRLRAEMHRGHATRDRVAEVLSIRANAYREGLAGEDVSAAETMEWAVRELSSQAAPQPVLIAFDGTLSAVHIEDFKRRLAEGLRRPAHWLPSGGLVSGSPTLHGEDGCDFLMPLPSPPSVDFPGVEGGEIHSTEDGSR